MQTKECPVCKSTFETKVRNKTYCTTQCQNKRYLKECMICGEEFRTRKNDSKTCSKICASELTKQKTRKEICYSCGIEFERPTNTFASDKERYFCSKTCNSRIYSRENPSRYGGTWTRRRKEVMKRDNYECRICKSSENLEAHHKVPVISFENPNDAHYDDNVCILCNGCHIEVEKGNLMI